MTYKLPELPYAYDALEPHIDTDTMKIHHTKHHQAYIDKANAALKDTQWSDLPVDEVLTKLNELPSSIKQTVRNNAGGHSNHSFFWTIMSPNGGGQPKGALAQKINSDLESFDAFKEKFIAAAIARFGSGWAWLCVDKDKKLVVTDTGNQDSPITDGLTPILGLDVWEHAYYLKYQNRRPEYISAFFNVVKWDEVERRFDEAVK